MTTRKILDRGNGDGAHGLRGGAARLRMLLALPAIAAAATALVACSSSGTTSGASSGGGSTGTSTPAAATAGSLKTTTIGGETVLTNARGSRCTRSPPTRPPSPTATGHARRTGRR